ncbi:hypothetical protein [Edwardsiella ictaluri]|uniref:Putative invasion plasmid antigen n=1 Tax=Edwardsiella ictaluri TaxID=67780 RepID=A0A0U2R015_EDWIC|nr:hypothetical protein [Edwardsiella ictaluri]ALT06056.1 putative invasion plasmid antigen [Edwardsiella ictaluri]
MIKPVRDDISKWTLSYKVDKKNTYLSSSLEKKQVFAASCGACALLVAAKELGIDDMSMVPSIYSEFTGGKLELTNECELDLYQITSGFTSYRRQSSDINKAGYSMPQNIMLACKLLGIECEITENRCFFSKSLSWIYPEVRKQCEGIGCQIKQETSDDADKLKIKAMVVSSASTAGIPAGLHWVLSRPDGSFMDPGVGKNSLNFNELINNAKEIVRGIKYFDSGISIVLSMPKHKTISEPVESPCRSALNFV